MYTWKYQLGYSLSLYAPPPPHPAPVLISNKWGKDKKNQKPSVPEHHNILFFNEGFIILDNVEMLALAEGVGLIKRVLPVAW